MNFIDWNNNGRIDPTDVGIGIALDSEKTVTNDNISQSGIIEPANGGSFIQALQASIIKFLNRK